MSGRIVHLEPDVHATVQILLPWYVTGKLEDSERNQVDEHLQNCPDCSGELEVERQLQWMQPQQSPPLDVNDSWQKMRLRIDATAVPTPQEAAPRPARARHHTALKPSAGRGRSSPWQWVPGAALGRAWAVPAMLSAGLLIVIVQMQFSTPKLAGDYQALASPATEAATAVVRFRPEATEAQIRHSLNESGARLVDGPTVTDAYVVRLPRNRYAASLDKLRKDPAVALVEALESAPSP